MQKDKMMVDLDTDELVLCNKLKKVKILALDFDGVFTDNKVYVDSNGNEMMCFDKADSVGLFKLRKETNIKVVVVTNEKNPVVQQRCNKLQVSLITTEDKVHGLTEYCWKHNIRLKDVCFVGNDINDLPCMKLVGVSIAVQSKTNLTLHTLLDYTDAITSHCGGDGAVRQVCNWLLSANKNEKLKIPLI